MNTMCSDVLFNQWTMTMPDTTFSVRLPEQLKNDVDSYASMTKRSRSFIVKEAIAAYMEERAAYLAELNEAVASIDTHPTYDFDKVTNWIKTWGTEAEKSLSEGDLSK